MNRNAKLGHSSSSGGKSEGAKYSDKKQKHGENLDGLLIMFYYDLRHRHTHILKIFWDLPRGIGVVHDKPRGTVFVYPLETMDSLSNEKPDREEELEAQFRRRRRQCTCKIVSRRGRLVNLVS